MPVPARLLYAFDLALLRGVHPVDSSLGLRVVRYTTPPVAADLVGHALDRSAVFADLRMTEMEPDVQPRDVHGNPDYAEPARTAAGGRRRVRMAPMSPERRQIGARATSGLAAIGGPAVLTALLLHAGGGQPRDYIFLYLGIVAALGITAGLVPALVAAAASFLLLDYYFVVPYHTLTIASGDDVVALVVFFSAAGVVGGMGSLRRRAHLRAEAMTRQLEAANRELERLSREQAEAAAVAVRLARTEQQVRVLEESDRVRREFLATVSHELRTPLAGVLTTSTVLAGRAELPSAVREDASSIAEQTRRLNRLVGDMLDMARIEGSTLDLRLEHVDLGQAVEASVDRLHRHAPDRTVDVDLPGGAAVVADWDRLGQVLDNLLLNADRFAAAGTPIAVRVSPGARGMVVIRVIDRGPGIPDELREHVFDHFVRGPGDGDGSGTGLGLAIVRGLVEAHGGRAWVDEPDGGIGTCIAFSLPAAPPDSEQAG